MVVQMYRVYPDNPKYQEYETKFNKGWTHAGKTARIKRIYLAKDKDVNKAYRGKRFNQYRGNKRYQTYFHGTQRACNIGRWGTSLRYCKKPDCSLCGIMWRSFDVKYTGPGCMFGAGIYTTPSSSKADIYAKNHRLFSRRHAMLICRVIASRQQNMTAADHSMTSPSPGYDSVRKPPTVEAMLN
ncbi:hypothetical protein EKO27_g10075 [Xylaria grammica]|uniref:PARP catalytic domain-containing protein n=1 Tax=Xylaria grammica TaxID=363999 RepID=A0A439CS63_9PEZI|nr:hypothetical protein EKO27_g10075 [Xylaria grammica]